MRPAAAVCEMRCGVMQSGTNCSVVQWVQQCVAVAVWCIVLQCVCNCCHCFPLCPHMSHRYEVCLTYKSVTYALVVPHIWMKSCWHVWMESCWHVWMKSCLTIVHVIYMNAAADITNGSQKQMLNFPVTCTSASYKRMYYYYLHIDTPANNLQYDIFRCNKHHWYCYPLCKIRWIRQGCMPQFESLVLTFSFNSAIRSVCH